ncbi:hypothetical protein H5410_048022, partial [Solanum commersonii]
MQDNINEKDSTSLALEPKPSENSPDNTTTSSVVANFPFEDIAERAPRVMLKSSQGNANAGRKHHEEDFRDEAS